MNTNLVANCTLIIRSQVEYSATTQTVVMRCLLETAATGQRRGFTNVDDLLIALRAELMELQSQILSLDSPNPENAARAGDTLAVPDVAALKDVEPPIGVDAPYKRKAKSK